jgi:hypothetical protein
VLLTSTPSHLPTQWQLLYDHGIGPVATLAISSGTGFAVLAYRSAPSITDIPTGGLLSSHSKRNLYIAASVAVFGLVPYTRILMKSTNNELMRRAKVVKEAGEMKGQGTHEMVRKWGRYNFVRGLMVLAGAGLGLWASLN